MPRQSSASPGPGLAGAAVAGAKDEPHFHFKLLKEPASGEVPMGPVT